MDKPRLTAWPRMRRRTAKAARGSGQGGPARAAAGVDELLGRGSTGYGSGDPGSSGRLVRMANVDRDHAAGDLLYPNATIHACWWLAVRARAVSHRCHAHPRR